MSERDIFLKKRVDVAAKVFVAVFAVLLLRLWYLQVMRGPEYTVLSQRNTIRLVRLEGIRGRILDRNGIILADNSAGFNVRIFRSGGSPDDAERWREASSRLDMDISLPNYPLRRHATLKKDASWDIVAWLSERNLCFPELSIEVYPKRSYPYGERLAHVLGYTGEISAGELERLRNAGYEAGDTIGKSGAESSLERYLRGREGGKQVLVNAYGHQLDVLAYKRPLRGNDVKLTIDYRVQEIVEREMGDRRGAVIVIDPRTGQLLGMASRPAFDPNSFSGTMTAEAWGSFLRREHSVFTNRAFQAAYPPGSTFKLFVAVAGLEGGTISRNDTYNCPGTYQTGNVVFRCWEARGHGRMNLKEAMVYSCNVYFYNLGQKTGITGIAEYAKKLGLGERTGIDLGAESPGLMPTSAWKRERFGQPWFPGDTVNASIGQGFVLTTPLQILNAYAAVANGGTVYKPQILHSVLSPEGGVLWESSPEIVSGIGEETAGFLRESFGEVVSRGTGMRASPRGYSASGKTGTAQNPHGEAHAWFVGFAPAESPLLAVVVVLENAGQGSTAAAPIFKNIVESVLDKGLVPGS